MDLRIVVKRTRGGSYLASCPNLEGCHVEADSEDAARELIKAAINAYVLSHKKRHEKIPYRQRD